MWERDVIYGGGSDILGYDRRGKRGGDVGKG